LIKKKYINQQIFLDLIYKALKAKVISINSSFIQKVGTPSDSIVSPILYNIYLHELDEFILKSPLLKKIQTEKESKS
jgi:retron-type reverse transcriptase